MLRFLGLAAAAGTVLVGLVRFEDPGRTVDLLASLVLGGLVGWVMGPIVVRGAGLGLRPEWFALLPIPAGRLAAGLLAASFRGFAPLATLAAFAVLPLAAARSGVAATLVAVPAMLLELVLVVVLSRVVVAGLAATLSSRRGQELGGLLMAVIIALASGGWSLATVLGQQLATGPAPALSTTLRVLPSGWGRWRRRPPAAPTGWSRWGRDPGRSLLLLALLISGLNLAVPAVAFDFPAALPWVGLAAALIVSMGAANLYGDDGTGLWLTRMVPGVERADVRGRQAAWLLVVAPAALALTAALTVLGGQGWAWRGCWPSSRPCSAGRPG